MNIVGVDPGITGAIALLLPSGALRVIDMPTVTIERNGKTKQEVAADQIRAEFFDVPPGIAYVEKVGAMPGQGVSSMFGFGLSTGLARGVFAGMGWLIELVPPQRWKKHFKLIGGDKSDSLITASDIYPNHEHLFTRVKDTGRSDATLIATYGAHKLHEQPN